MDKVESIKKMLYRERDARKKAEQVIEEKSLELYHAYQSLKQFNDSLEQLVIERTCELELAKEEAERANSAKSDFLSNISHELRTPLNSLIGITYLLLNESPREDQRESLQTMKSSADQLLGLINDVLDFSKIEAGKLELEHTEFEFSTLIDSVNRVIAHKAQDKGLKIIFTSTKHIPDRLIGDSTRLTQVLMNLLSNAIKFTERGFIEVIASCRELEGDQIYLDIQVKDTGIGIPKHRLGSIFESFEQSDKSITRRFGGTGLGLAITKRLIELQGGSIGVSSELGVGTNFYFSVKVAKNMQQRTAAPVLPTKNLRPIDLNKVHILLVEDNIVNQKVIKRIIEKFGVKVSIAADGSIALKEIKKQCFQLVLMDIHMPNLDGVSATRKIRAIEGDYYKYVPIIALSASLRKDLEAEVLEAGMNGMASKPFEPEKLERMIAEHVQSFEQRHLIGISG